MSGFVGDLSAKQERALEQLKANVADAKLQEDDYFYLRWLRARNFNVEKAENMLRNNLQFLEKMEKQMEGWTAPEVLTKFFPTGFFGEDVDGHPVSYDNLGNLDFRGLHMSVSKDDVFRLKMIHAKRMEALFEEFSEKKGRKIETITNVLDMENLSYQRHYYWPGINMMREILAVLEANFPERTKAVLVVKAPRVFPIAYNLIKPFLDERTRKKIVVLGSNWREEMLQYIAPDQLPMAYGGTRCEPDPMCTKYINPGYDIPKEYYRTNLTETSLEEMEKVFVGRGSVHDVECVVDVPGTFLRWEFVTKDHDIGFGIFLKKKRKKKFAQKTNKIVEVVASKRATSNLVPEVGDYECAIPGTYVLKFDNSYSWTKGKELYYSLKALPPDTELCEPVPLSNSASSSSEDQFFDCEEEPTDETTEPEGKEAPAVTNGPIFSVEGEVGPVEENGSVATVSSGAAAPTAASSGSGGLAASQHSASASGTESWEELSRDEFHSLSHTFSTV